MGRDDGGGLAGTEGDRAAIVFGAVVTSLGAVALLAPSLLSRRFALEAVDQASILLTLRAVGPALIAMGAAAFLSRSRWWVGSQSFPVGFGLLVVAGYLSLTTCLRDWMVDDAAITFAYSRSLAQGHGLVIRPGHVPEEGYSNTSWMLFLAAARWLGADIAVTAKRACIACGALATVLCIYVCHQLTDRRARFALLALGATVCLGAPFVIWSASGLEHAAQAALLAAIIAAPLWPRIERWLMAAALAALVLTRPEAPLVVAFVAAVLLLRDRSWPAIRAAVARYWPVVVVPGLAWAALTVFRLAYFHELLSNPYYAKATDANWFRLANFVGGGWSYVFGWLADARTWL
ncbi:MAG: hypothetical protein QOI66_5111, partial [Myxococcales bacterium]|nr:hypothetical protein [Myxococcales bacterium]